MLHSVSAIDFDDSSCAIRVNYSSPEVSTFRKEVKVKACYVPLSVKRCLPCHIPVMALLLSRLRLLWHIGL